MRTLLHHPPRNSWFAVNFSFAAVLVRVFISHCPIIWMSGYKGIDAPHMIMPWDFQKDPDHQIYKANEFWASGGAFSFGLSDHFS